MEPIPTQLPPPRSRRRFGCLRSLVGFFVFGTLAFIAIRAVFAPWAFYLGGDFHVLPQWEGWGKLHAKSGDFPLFIYMYPSPVSRMGYPSVSGTATLCTPRGERFRLRLSGGMLNKHIGLNTDGEPMALHIHYRPYWYGFNMERRPRLDLKGTWRNPNLVMNDRGTLASAVLPDGTVYLGNEHKQPPRGEPLQITLAPGSRADFDAACRAAVH
jgi:hypothetical protein